MKKTNNKKGFTIVELVIVIAVIAILAAVLIPTFSGAINKANESAALQEATALYKDAYAVAISDGKIATGEGNAEKNYEIVEAGELFFAFVSADGSIDADKITVTVYNETPTVPDNLTFAASSAIIDGYNVTVVAGVVKVTPAD